MKIGRRTFLGGVLATAAMPAWSAEGGRIARVGIMTDTHVGTTMDSCAKVRAALQLFRAKGAEMVVNCGDIADQHYPDGYRCYRRTVNEVYPEASSRPKEVFVYAFHDVCNYKPGSGWNLANAAPAFADVERLLEAPNGPVASFVWKGLPILAFPQSTGMKGFLSWDDYDKAVAKACAENPGKPVFVFDHLPPAGTTFHSRHWGSEPCRRILNKYPQVVSISGHVHGSLVSERQIWQGEFTAVNAGCLQTWGGFAPGSTPPPQAKPNYGVLLMDVYADRLVFFRYDVRDGGSEVAKPWVVPLPFAAREAPFHRCAHASRHARAAFAAGASVAVTASKDGYRIEFPEARTACDGEGAAATPERDGEGAAATPERDGEGAAATSKADAFMYRLACQRKNAAGEWVTFTRDDIFGDFWKAEKDRTGKMSYTLSPAFFTKGGAYRITVTPLDWFYRETRAIAADFTASVGQGAAVWTCADPKTELRFTEYGKPVEQSVCGRYAPASGQGTLRLPDHAFKSLKPGERACLVLDLDMIQPDGEWCAWRLSFRARGGRNLVEAQTVPGAPGVLRYALAFTVPPEGLDTCDMQFNYVSPGASLRVVSASCCRI